MPPPSEPARLLRLGVCTVDLAAATVERPDGIVRLTPFEVKLLERLAATPGQEVSREALQREVWGYQPSVVSRTVDTTVRRLRTKIEARPGEPRHLLTVHGQGYVLQFEAPGIAADPAFAGFVGRGDELGALQALVAEQRLVTVVGPPGVGKTRLAVELGRRRADSVPIVRLADTSDLAALTRRVAREVGVPLGPGDDDALVAQVGAALASRSGVIVLDNLEQVIGPARIAVARWLEQAPGLGIVATSQVPLHLPEEGVLRLAGLAVDDAVRLYAERSRAAGAAPSPEDLDAARSLVQRFDGLPLAIELLGARSAILPAGRALARLTVAPAPKLSGFERASDEVAGSGGVRSDPGSEGGKPRVSRQSERLGSRFEVAAHPRRGAERHGSLALALEWAWDLLDPHQRLVLQGCALFAGPFSLELAEELLRPVLPERGLAPIDVVHELVDRSFVEADGRGRLRLLENVREYARLRSRADGSESTLREAHRAALLRWSQPLADRWGGSDVATRVQALSERTEDLLAAREGASPEEQLALALALHLPLRYHGPRDLHQEALSAAWAASEGVADPVGRARLAIALADLLRARGRFSAGEEILASVDVPGLMSAIGSRIAAVSAYLAHLRGEPSLAAERIAEAYRRAEGDAVAQVAVGLYAGVMALDRSESKVALEHLEPAARRLRETGDLEMASAVHLNRSQAWLGRGDVDEALDALEEAQAADQSSLWRQVGNLHVQHGEVLRARGDLEEALVSLGAAVGHYLGTGQTARAHDAQIAEGWALLELGRLDEVDRSMRNLRRHGIDRRWLLPQATAILGLTRLFQGRPADAEELLAEAIAALPGDMARHARWFRPWLAVAVAAGGDVERARVLLAEAAAHPDPGIVWAVRLAAAAVDGDRTAGEAVLAASKRERILTGVEHVRLLGAWITR